LRAAGVHFRNEIVTGPGGQQILLDDPSGNPIELFQPAAARSPGALMDLTNAAPSVTGGGEGFGAATVRRLAQKARIAGTRWLPSAA
jgi:hypothetical protein